MVGFETAGKIPLMKTIAIIPARGGSKGIPKKNIITFCGKPLLSWTIQVALKSTLIDGVFVSTDSSEIAAVAQEYGAKVVMRPSEISGDLATSESALLHACEEVKKIHAPDLERIVFLQATSPLRESNELDGALKKFVEEDLDSLFSASMPEDMLFWRRSTMGLESINYDYQSRKRRQDMDDKEVFIIETGSFYITKYDLLKKQKNRLGGKIGVWPVELWKSFEIDSQSGLELCETLMRIKGLLV